MLRFLTLFSFRPKAWFRHRTFHVPNKFDFGPTLSATSDLDDAQVKFDRLCRNFAAPN